MAGLQLTVTQTIPRTYESGITVTADTEIVTLTPDMHSNPVSFFTIKAVPQAAGKLYVTTDDGYDEYLTSSDTDWPAKQQILVTYVIHSGRTASLKFTADTTFSSLVICEGSGVY